jgi:hypothetical protein
MVWVRAKTHWMACSCRESCGRAYLFRQIVDIPAQIVLEMFVIRRIVEVSLRCMVLQKQLQVVTAEDQRGMKLDERLPLL